MHCPSKTAPDPWRRPMDDKLVSGTYRGLFARRATGVLCSMLFSAGALGATIADVDAAMSYDGLEKIKVKDIDLAYARPGATLAGYKHVMLDPVDVAFRKNWAPMRTGSNLPLGEGQQEKIRTGIARVVAEEFTKTLQAKDGYDTVAESGPDVLRVKTHIINLYVNAPDTMTAGRSKTYTITAGEMTMFMELHDSETGELLARFVD